MSWGKGICTGIVLAAASIALSATAAQAGVVVSSSGPSAGSFPVGKQIGSDEPVTLRDGDSITILDNGGTRVFRGAGTFVLSSRSGSNRNRAFASLTTQRSATRARTGAVRNPDAGTEVRNPNLWYVDVSASGTICLNDPANIRLWRPNTQAQSTYTIAAEGSSPPVSVTFPAGEMLAAWEAGSLPNEKSAYTIGSGSSAAQISFVFLDEVPEDAEAMAEALIANGCMVQLEQMSDAMMAR